MRLAAASAPSGLLVAPLQSLSRAAVRGLSADYVGLRAQSSPLWNAAKRYLVATQPSETWHHDCMLYAAYHASLDQRPMTAIFAMSGASQRLDHFALVDDETNAIVHQAQSRGPGR